MQLFSCATQYIAHETFSNMLNYGAHTLADVRVRFHRFAQVFSRFCHAEILVQKKDLIVLCARERERDGRERAIKSSV